MSYTTNVWSARGERQNMIDIYDRIQVLDVRVTPYDVSYPGSGHRRKFGDELRVSYIVLKSSVPLREGYAATVSYELTSPAGCQLATLLRPVKYPEISILGMRTTVRQGKDGREAERHEFFA